MELKDKIIEILKSNGSGDYNDDAFLKSVTHEILTEVNKPKKKAPKPVYDFTPKKELNTGLFHLTNEEINHIINGRIRKVFIEDSYYTINPEGCYYFITNKNLVGLKLTKCDENI